jgi:predicted NBD/HSP70 family sugar kinase
VSRADLATLTGLSKAIVSERVRWLVGSGLLEETGANASTGGRRGTALSLTRSRGVVVAAEVAMTHLQVTVFSFAHELLWEERVPVSMWQGPGLVLDELERAIERGLAATEAHHPLCGIGVGIAGPVEFETGRTIHPPVHPDWHDQPVRDRLQQRFGVPARVDNEVNLMALAERTVGHGRNVRDLLVIKVGSFVGAGLISNGKLHRGAQGSAGSLVTSQGSAYLVEQASVLVDSGRSPLLAEATRDGQEITARMVVEAAQRGDEASRELLDKAAESIGQVLSVLVDFFNPATIVVAGRPERFPGPDPRNHLRQVARAGHARSADRPVGTRRRIGQSRGGDHDPRRDHRRRPAHPHRPPAVRAARHAAVCPKEAMMISLSGRSGLRLLGPIAAGMTLALVLAACGTTTGGGSGGTSGALKPGEKATLTVVSQFGDNAALQPVLMKLNEAYEAKHPEVTVTIQFLSADDEQKTLPTALASGSGPDIFDYDAAPFRRSVSSPPTA